MEGCEHEWGEAVVTRGQTGGNGRTSRLNTRFKLDGTFDGKAHPKTDAKIKSTFCRLCGAWRGALGLEPTIELYVRHLVTVFREIRRVLRKDGTCWLNLGSSYASANTKPIPSPLPQNESAYDIYDKARPDSIVSDRAYPDSDGECPDGSQNHHVRISHTDQVLRGFGEQPCMKGHDSDSKDCLRAEASPGVSSLSARESNTSSSIENVRGACGHVAKASASLSKQNSISADAQECADMAFCTSDIVSPSQTSVHHTSGKESSDVASETSYKEPIALTLLYSTINALNFKPKDLLPISSLVRIALQADGWYCRQRIIWAKGVSFCKTYSGSSMPESVTDRPSTSYEDVYLLSKSARYFYDNEAVKEESLTNDPRKPYGSTGAWLLDGRDKWEEGAGKPQDRDASKRNLRSVWLINPRPFKEAHFATFPPALVEPMIKAGTSERGVCPSCKAPWRRVVEKGERIVSGHGGSRKARELILKHRGATSLDHSIMVDGKTYSRRTLGWEPTCSCGLPEEDCVPAIVLDCFAGSCTSIMVALRLGRRGLGIEIKPEYVRMGERRIIDDAPLWNTP